MLGLLLLAMCCILVCSEEFTMICAVLVEMEVCPDLCKNLLDKSKVILGFLIFRPY